VTDHDKYDQSAKTSAKKSALLTRFRGADDIVAIEDAALATRCGTTWRTMFLTASESDS
jgi:hypothetical protein